MKILLIGDSPEYIGGVCNYTRPLHKELNLLGHEVHYLFSSGGYKKNYNYLFVSYLKSCRKSKKLFWHEIINSPNGIINFKNPLLDIDSPKIENIVETLLIKIKPDVIHINEMIGFSSKIIKIAKNNGIKVVVTVHEYWWLCLHRVMIDFNKAICNGPNDIKKCAFCVSERYIGSKVDSKIKLAIRNTNPSIFEFLLNVKNKLRRKKGDDLKDDKLNIEINDLNYTNYYREDEKFESKLYMRFEANIHNLNKSDVIIGVSNEVKQILINYGIEEKKIIVQHIGSLIATQKIEIKRENGHKRVVFGFIGGVTYYKGIHVLVEAYLKLKPEFLDKSEILIFGKYQESYKSAIDLKYGSQNGYKNIKYLGKYFAEDLKDIYPQIDIMVLPSTCNDTAPQTIFESYAAGIPIIGSNIGGFPDFIEQDKNGLLFEVGNSDDLKEKMEYILENPKKIKEYRTNIPKLKTIEENAKELIELYGSI